MITTFLFFLILGTSLSQLSLAQNERALSPIKRTVTCPNTGPNITISTATNNAFQKSNGGTTMGYINYTATALCSGTVTCAFNKTDSASYVPSLSSVSIDFTLPSNVAIGEYTILLNCTEVTPSSGSSWKNVTVPFAIYTSGSITILNSGSTVATKDSIPLLITPSQITVQSIGGVPTRRLCYAPRVSSGYFTRNSTSSLPSPSDCDFTQADIDASLVYYEPQALDTPATSATVDVTFLVWDSYDKATAIYPYLKFAVTWGYVPRIRSSTITISAGSSSPATVQYALFSYLEAHMMSGWGIQWTIPSIGSFGEFQYYCPDSLCGGPKWNTLGSGSQISMGWILMNALSWNPKGQPTSSNTYTMIGSYPSDPSIAPTVGVQLSVFSAGTGNLLAPPYQNYGSGCTGLKVGVVNSTIPTIPFETFTTVNSPIRPLCASQNTTNNVAAQFGDIWLKVPAKLEVTISGWVSIDSSFQLPSGFSKLAFTGNISTVGTVGSAILITYNSNATYSMELITPPVLFDANNVIGDVSKLAVLRYNSTTKVISYISVNSWDVVAPYVMNVTIPGPGVYIFGTLDNSQNTEIPLDLGSSLSYVGAWSSKSLVLDANLTAKVVSDIDATIKISRPTYIIAADDLIYVSVYNVESTLSPSKIQLTYSSIYPGLEWAYFKYDSYSASGGSWASVSTGNTSVTDNTTQRTQYSVKISQLGQWAMVSRSVLSEGRGLSPSTLPLIFSLVLSLYLLV